MDGRRNSAANGGTGIPFVRSSIPRPATNAATNNNDSSIPRPASRNGVLPVTSSIPRTGISGGGPMGSYRASVGGGGGGGAAARIYVGGSGASASTAARPAPSSAAPPTRTYGGLAGRISTLSARPVDNAATNMLGLSADEIGSTSTLLDTSIGSKRSVSVAGIGEDSVSFSHHNNGPKRAHLRKLSMDGTSPLLLQAELHHHPAATTPRPESPAYEISVLRTHYDQQLLAEARKYKKLEQDFEAKCKELDRFNRQRVELLNEWDKQQEQKREKEQEWITKRQSLEDEIVRLRSTNSELTNKLDEVNSSTTSSISELRSRNTALETQLGHTKAELEATESKSKMLEDEVGANKAEIEDLQNALEDEQRMRIQERDSARFGGGGEEEAKKLGEELNQLTSHLRKLEAANAHLIAENGRLTQHSNNVELLKEEKRSLESKVRVLDQLRMQLAASENKIKDLEQENTQWEDLLRNGIQGIQEDAFAAATAAASANVDDGVLSPKIEPPSIIDRTSLPKYLSKLRGTVSGLEVRCRGLSASLEKLRARNLSLEEEAKDVSSRETKLQNEVSALQTSLSKSEKTESRLKDQVSRLQSILESYETEEKNHNTTTTNYDAAHAKRIAVLEEDNEKLRAENTRLTEDLDNVSTSLAEREKKAESSTENVESLRSQIEVLTLDKTTLETKVSEMEASISSLSKELEELGRENEVLWGRVGRGEFDQERQRCLVLAVNPISQDLDLRRKTLDALKTENAGLLKRVEELSALVNSSSSNTVDQADPGIHVNGGEALVPRSVVENLRLDIEGLHASIAAKDKAMLRLKQVFSAKANEFREAIQSLFGYKVKFLENGKVKLTSTFNRSKNSTTLIFESLDTDDNGGKNIGKMKLMGEAIQFPGLVNLASLKEYWLNPNGIRQSVPCFLAALNLELYESCTMAVRRSNVNHDEEDEDME